MTEYVLQVGDRFFDRWISRRLHEHISLELAYSFDEACKKLQQKFYSLILVDLSLDDPAIEAFGRKMSSFSSIVIGVVGGADNHEYRRMQQWLDMTLRLPEELAILEEVIGQIRAVKCVNTAYFLDEQDRVLRGPTGQPIPLSEMEMRLLAFMGQSAARAYSVEELKSGVSKNGKGYTGVPVLISRLQKKFKDGTQGQILFRSVRNVGYCLVQSVTTERFSRVG